MIEKTYRLSDSRGKTIERVVLDENLHYLHVVLPAGDGLPEHFTNANVYMTVVGGSLSIGLGEQEDHVYGAGTLLKIPPQTKMTARNLHGEALELIIVKAPPPKS